MQSGISVFSIEHPNCLLWKFSFFASAAQVVVSPILMRWSLFAPFKFHMCTPLDHSEDDGNTTMSLENIWIFGYYQWLDLSTIWFCHFLLVGNMWWWWWYQCIQKHVFVIVMMMMKSKMEPIMMITMMMMMVMMILIMIMMIIMIL